MASTIDRASPIPYYFQLATLLEHEIVSGEWEIGGQIPSEPQLAAHYEVSRSVVRQALARLEQSGLIARRKGEGTFVNREQPRSWLLQSSHGLFQDEALRAGQRVTSRLVGVSDGELPGWACDALQLEPGSHGVTLERVRSVDDLVAVYAVNHLPQRYADTVLGVSDSASLYERLFEDHGVRPAGGSRTLEAVTAGERLAPLLEVTASASLLFVKSVSWDRERVPFDCYRAWVRTDRMKIDIQVAAAPAGIQPAEEARAGAGDDTAM